MPIGQRHGALGAGRRPSSGSAGALPTGTVTFLFTDLEGHTRLWELDPEAMQRALAWHDTIVRAAIEGNGGCVVKTTGDGFHAVFESAAGALAGAIAAQRDLSTEQWPTARPLSARMALPPRRRSCATATTTGCRSTARRG